MKLTIYCIVCFSFPLFLMAQNQYACLNHFVDDTLGQSQYRQACKTWSECDLILNRNQYLDISNLPTKYIKVRWNIIRDENGEAPFDSLQVQSLMEQLNEDYQDHKIQFWLDEIAFTDDSILYYETYILPILSYYRIDSTFKQQTGGNFDKVLNIYIVGINQGDGAFATFPFRKDDKPGGPTVTSGVVSTYTGFRDNENTHVLTHEVGHVFGLWHVFQGYQICDDCHEYPDTIDGKGINGDQVGDYLSDTYPKSIKSIPCDNSFTTIDECSNVSYQNAPNTNYMDYTDCPQEFTPQQVARMHCMIETHLSSWINYDATVSTDQLKEKRVNIYPNPVDQELIVSNVSELIPFEIYDLQGRLLQNGRVNNEISVIGLSQGIYLLRMGTQVFKFVKR